MSIVLVWNGDWGRGCDEAEISEEKRLFTEWGQGIQWMKAWVSNSTGKAIQWRGFGHSMNRRILWIETSVLIPFPNLRNCSCSKSSGIHFDYKRTLVLVICLSLRLAWQLGVMTFRRLQAAVTGPSQLDLPLWHPLDLIRTWTSGFKVRVRSKSGLVGGFGRGRGRRGRSSLEGPLAAWKVLGR